MQNRAITHETILFISANIHKKQNLYARLSKKNKVSVYLCGKFASLVSIVVYKIIPESVKTWLKSDKENFISEDYPFPSDYSHLSEDLPKKNPGPCLNRSSSRLL